MNKRAITLIEIIVSTVILAMVVAGLTNIFVAGTRWIKNARSRTAGIEFGKIFLDPLQQHVRQHESFAGANDGWNQVNNALRITTAGYTPTVTYCDSVGGHLQNPICASLGSRTINGITYDVEYHVSRTGRSGPPGPTVTYNARRVEAIITWTEPVVE